MRFRRMLLNILQGKTRGKKNLWEKSLGKKTKASSYNNIKGGTLMRSACSWGARGKKRVVIRVEWFTIC